MRFNVVFAVRQLNVLIFSDDSIHLIKQLIRHRLTIKSVMFMVVSSVFLTWSKQESDIATERARHRGSKLQSDSKTHVKFEYAFYLGKGLSINVFDMANKMSHMWY